MVYTVHGNCEMTVIGRYRPLAKAFHWLTALLVLLTIPAALTMLTPGIERSLQDPLFTFHKNIGVVIFVLVALRLAYRLINPPPPLPASVPAWQRHVASLTHWLLYGLLFAMASSGYIRVTAGGFPLEVFDPLGLPRPVPRSEEVAEIAKGIHAALRYPLIALIVLHIGAALHHALIKRDGVFQRMTVNR
jgi:cytochrome b561